MKVVYRASNILEAHIVVAMLRAQGLGAKAGGHYLQGGIGEIAPMGFATVSVDESALIEAEALIREYENAPPD